MSVDGRATSGKDPEPYLTLSAVGDLGPEDARIATAIERELERIDRERNPGRRRRRVDRLIRFVWGDAA